MAKLPAFQFYPGDWMKDANLRRCSHAAKGVWMDMLCLMFECDERGVLASGGSPWTLEEIALAVGGAQDVTVACIEELLCKGVARRRQGGAVFSARLVRDEQTRNERSKSGSKGGSTTQAKLKQTIKQTSSKPSSKLQANPQANLKQIPEDEDEDEDEVVLLVKGDARGKPQNCADFDAFWAYYPRKENKAAARKAWLKADLPPLAVLLAAIDAQRQTDGWRRGFVPHGSTWLNNARWEDEVQADADACVTTFDSDPDDPLLDEFLKGGDDE